MLIEDADSLGKAFFNLCASADGGTTTESDSEAVCVGFWRALHSRFFLTCSFWVPLDSVVEKTWLFGLRALNLAWF